MEPANQVEVKSALLLTVVPLGLLNVPALVIFPLLLLVIAGDLLDFTDSWLWVGGVWCGATLQGLILRTRHRWWHQRSVESWEAAYAITGAFIGLSWAAALLIGHRPEDDLAVQSLVMAFLAMTSAAAVLAFAGSRLIGLSFLLGQWLTATTIFVFGGHWKMASLSVVIYVVSVGYSEVSHRVLAQAVQARLRSAELAEELARQATTDPLTGLPNRLAIVRGLQTMIDQSEAPTVLFIDLDGFKDINDGFGHAKGDDVLIEIADRLGSVVRDTDVVARLGGDEFVIILPGPLEGDVLARLADDIIVTVAEPIGEAPTVALTASVGIAQASDDDLADRVLARADLAMYAAKNEGGDKTLLFDRDHELGRLNQIDIRRELRAAIADKEIEVYAQPIVSLADRSISGYELLARWNRPNGLEVSPTVFVALAEELALDRELGRIMLDRAAWAASRSNHGFGVNITAGHLMSGRLVEDLVDAVRCHRASFGQLTIEITESQLLVDIDRAIEQLHRLTALGTGIAIDDFGTGNSSLATLERLPAMWLKLAPDFGQRLPESERAAQVVRRMAELATDLDFELVAEGIETETSSDGMRAAGVRFGQGYLFARPLPLTDLLTSQSSTPIPAP